MTASVWFLTPAANHPNCYRRLSTNDGTPCRCLFYLLVFLGFSGELSDSCAWKTQRLSFLDIAWSFRYVWPGTAYASRVSSVCISRPAPCLQNGRSKGRGGRLNPQSRPFKKWLEDHLQSASFQIRTSTKMRISTSRCNDGSGMWQREVWIKGLGNHPRSIERAEAQRAMLVIDISTLVMAGQSENSWHSSIEENQTVSEVQIICLCKLDQRPKTASELHWCSWYATDLHWLAAKQHRKWEATPKHTKTQTVSNLFEAAILKPCEFKLKEVQVGLSKELGWSEQIPGLGLLVAASVRAMQQNASLRAMCYPRVASCFSHTLQLLFTTEVLGNAWQVTCRLVVEESIHGCNFTWFLANLQLELGALPWLMEASCTISLTCPEVHG